MGFFRVLEFPAEDSYFGSYKLRIPVVDDSYKGTTTTVESGSVESLDDLIANLEYAGFGSSLIDLFTDLRYNNKSIGDPPGYKPNFLLHQVYPNVQASLYNDNTQVTGSLKLWDNLVNIPTNVKFTKNNQNIVTDIDFAAHYQDDSNILRHEINLAWRNDYFYWFDIIIAGVYTSNLNGNKFDFSEENPTCPLITIHVARDREDPPDWFYSIIISGIAWGVGLDLKQSMDGNETDDAEQDSDDPYDDGGDSGSGGGGGSFDDDSDDVDFPPLPDISAADTGFVSLYVPTAVQIKDLANYMWNNILFDISAFKKLFADPMDCVIGLSIVPYAVPTSGAVNVAVGNIPTGISMNKASGQFFELDCGSIDISEYFGSYLDYAPYTSIQIYLPFIGYRDLKIDECIGPKPGLKVHLKYHIDILSGSCVARIKCGSSMMYQYQGHCSVEIPFTGVEYANMIKSSIDATTAIANISAGSGNINNELGSVANAVMSCKPLVERSGKIGSSGGLMAGQHPYLIITRPRQCKPENQNHYLGYPAFITENIGGLVGKGYSSFEAFRLNNIKCNDEEMEEIMALLKEGVIL